MPKSGNGADRAGMDAKDESGKEEKSINPSQPTTPTSNTMPVEDVQTTRRPPTPKPSSLDVTQFDTDPDEKSDRTGIIGSDKNVVLGQNSSDGPENLSRSEVIDMLTLQSQSLIQFCLIILLHQHMLLPLN